MAYTNFQHCTANEYKNIVYNQETNNKIKVLFNNVELEDADEYCESFEVVSRVIPNGSKIFMLENLVSQEATLVLHNIDTSIIQDQVSISIGTLVSENTYEYVPIGIYNLQEIPTTDNGKTTIKLRDNSVKLDFNYNAKPLIDEHGGTATKLQILQNICSQANITCNVSSFIGSSDLIGIYDNTITGRQYVVYLAGSAGAIPIITRSGALDFKYLNNLSTIEIPIEIVEQYSNAENFKISRVVYEDAIRKYESGNENYDTLFLDSANPYISSQEQVASIYNIVNNFEINSFKTGRILGNPAIDSYDLIQITDYDGTIFKTFANNTLRYNGKMINTFASEISFERKKENVSLKSGATFKKWAKTEIDNANAQITIQSGQIDEIEQELANPTSIKEGEYFDLEDALDEPLIDFSLYGETQQASEPTPSSPQPIHNVSGDNTIEICGKQLFNPNDTYYRRSTTYQSLTINGDNLVADNASTSANGYIWWNIPVKIGESYTISYSDMVETTASANNRVIYQISDTPITSYSNISSTNINKTDKYKTILATDKNLLIGLGIGNDNSYTISNLMIEKGEVETPIYEAYTGNSQLISLGVENLISQTISSTSLNDVTLTSNGDGTYTLNGTASANTSFNIYNGDLNLDNGTYFLNGCPSGGSTSTFKLAWNVAGRTTNDFGSGVSFTGSATNSALWITIYSGYTCNNLVFKPQIIKGNKWNSFTPYGTTPIELCKIGDYQDYIYKDNDRWFLHKEIGKVVLDGSEESWRRVDVYKGISQFEVLANDVLYANDGVLRTLSNFFKGIPYNNSWSYDNSITSVYTSRLRVMTRMYSSVDDFKTWLSTHNTIVYYVLATPTDTEITDTTLLEQLNNLMTLPLYKNMTHITLTPNDLQPTMKIEYYRDTSINENFVPKEDMTKYYTKTETNAQIQITSGSIMSEVSRVENKTDANNEYTSRVETSVTNLQTDTRTLLTFKQNVEQNGVETLKNTLIQADINGLSITKGESFNTQITDRTLEVNSNNKELIFLGYDNDLKKTVARIDDIESKRATIGVHRCETTGTGSNKRTAWFYVGGGN